MKKKYHETVLLAKTKLNSIEILVSWAIKFIVTTMRVD